MKILSNDALTIELNKTLICDINRVPDKVEANESFLVRCINTASDSNDILLDIKDIEHIVNDKSLVIMSTAEYHGTNAIIEAMRLVILDIETEKFSLISSDGILVHFKINSDYSYFDTLHAMEIIYTLTKQKPNILYGISCDKNIEKNYAQVNIFVSYS